MDRRSLVRLLLVGGAYGAVAACSPAAAPTAKPKPSGLPVVLESPPSLDGVKGWLNSKPLKLGDLHGAPSLLVFWTYT